LTHDEDAYKCDDNTEMIKKGTVVKFRVLNRDIFEGKMSVVGTIGDDYLGPIGGNTIVNPLGWEELFMSVLLW